MMEKKMFLIFGLVLLLISCKDFWLPGDDDPIPEPDWTELEILYERVLPVIRTYYYKDITDSKPSIYHGILGGQDPSLWIDAGNNKWKSSIELTHHKLPYYICVYDYEVIRISEEDYFLPIARKLCVRAKGQSDWIELTCIEENKPFNGEWAAFLVKKSGIRNPCLQ